MTLITLPASETGLISVSPSRLPSSVLTHTTGNYYIQAPVYKCMGGYGGISDGLRHQHQQGPLDQNDTHPRAVPTPTGLNPEDEKKDPEKAFVSPSHDGNLYNTENDKPVMPEVAMTEPGSNRKDRDLKRLDRVKLNDHVAYSYGEGTVIGKHNLMVQIANDDTNHIDVVPIGETYFKEDSISAGNIENQMWDLMAQQTRSYLLTKYNIIGDTQKAYLYRDWDDMPRPLREILTDKAYNYFDDVPHGGVEGREPSHNDENEESRSHRDLTQPPHVTAPYKDPQAPGAKKSDVEHNVLGGIVTDTPIDATDEYEDDRPKKPLSGAEAEGGATGQSVENKRPDLSKEPLDPKDKPTDEKWDERQKDQQQAAITGKPDLREGDETVEKDEDSGVRPESAGFKGSTTNAQASEKTETDMTAITGEPNENKDKDKVGPTHGQGPQHMDKAYELEIINKYNSRWGPRTASKEDIKRLMEDNP